MNKCFFLFSVLFLFACGRDQNEILPGERYALDTLLSKEYANLENQALKECDRRKDSLFKKTYDSLFKIRAADIKMIRNAPIPTK